MVEMVRKLVVNEWQWLLVEMISLIRGDDHSDPSSLSASFSSSPPLSSSLPSLSALAFEDQYFNIFIAVDFDISTTTAPTSDTYQRVPLSDAFWKVLFHLWLSILLWSTSAFPTLRIGLLLKENIFKYIQIYIYFVGKALLILKYIMQNIADDQRQFQVIVKHN